MRKKERQLNRAERLVSLCSKSYFSKRPHGTRRTFLEDCDISFDGRVDKVKLKRQKRGLTRVIFNSVWFDKQEDKEGIFNPSEIVDSLFQAIRQADSP